MVVSVEPMGSHVAPLGSEAQKVGAAFEDIYVYRHCENI